MAANNVKVWLSNGIIHSTGTRIMRVLRQLEPEQLQAHMKCVDECLTL
jgi:hypothetical protein